MVSGPCREVLRRQRVGLAATRLVRLLPTAEKGRRLLRLIAVGKGPNGSCIRSRSYKLDHSIIERMTSVVMPALVNLDGGTSKLINPPTGSRVDLCSGHQLTTGSINVQTTFMHYSRSNPTSLISLETISISLIGVSSTNEFGLRRHSLM
jgi:hypothetical protein